MRGMASNKSLRTRLFVFFLMLGAMATIMPASIARVPAAASPREVRWVPARNGERPNNAVEIGRERHGENDGEMLYVCRARHEGGVHPGKLIGSTCNIGYGGVEIEKSEYEVAVYSGGSWRAGNREGALVGGFENNDVLYVCRVEFTRDLVRKSLPSLRTGNYGMHGGKLLPNGLCNVGYGGQEISSSEYELFYP